MNKERERRRRLVAAYRAIAPLAPKDRQPDEIEVKEGDTANPPEDLPQVSRASHYS